MLHFVTTLLATLPSILRSRAALELENLALRQQVGVLQRSASKRVKLTPLDRLLWAWLSRIWSDWRTDHERICPWGRTRLSQDPFSRQKWDRSWRCHRSEDCTTATNDEPPETHSP